MAADPLKQMAFLAQYPLLVQNSGALEQLGSRLSDDDRANLGKVGIDLKNPMDSSPESLRYLNGMLQKNPKAVENLAALPPQVRSEAFRQAAEKGQKGIYDFGALAEKTPSPGTNPPSSPTESPQVQQPTASGPAQTNAAAPTAAGATTTPQAVAGPTAQGPNMLDQMMASNPEMASMMSRMTEVMQGLMGKLMTGLLSFIGKIFGGLDGSGGGLFAASNNPGSNNLGNALAIGGADRHASISLQVGDNAPQDATVGALQQRGAAPPAPATLDPANRLALTEPQMEPGRA